MNEYYNRGTVPSPFHYVSDELNSCNASFPGEITMTLEAKLLSKYFVYSKSISSDIIASFNQFINTDIPAILESKALVSKDRDGTLFYTVFRHPIVTKPTYVSSGGSDLVLYPSNARTNYLTYASSLYVVPVMYKIVNGQYKEVSRGERKEIGRLPIMTGSSSCHLSDISDPRELASIGEDPWDPQGYFIINGVEKTIVNIDKMRINRIYVFKGSKAKYNPYAQIIVPTATGTKLIRLIMSNDAVELQLSSFRKQEDGKKYFTINIMHIVSMIDEYFIKDKSGRTGALGRVGVEQVFSRLIAEFTPPNEQRRVFDFFSSTLVMATASVWEHSFNRLTANLGISKLENADKVTKIREIFIENLFPNIPETASLDKIRILAIMTSHLMRFLAGYTKATDKDTWANKKLESPGKTYEQHFRKLFKKMMMERQIEINQKSCTTLSSFGKLITSTIITDGLMKAFTSTNLGIQGSFARQNMTDPIDAQNLIDLMSHLTKIDVKMDRNTKSATVRAVQGTGEGVICPAQTPDDRSCGVVKNKACTAIITTDVPSGSLIQLMKTRGYVVGKISEETPHYVMVNGTYIGWSEGAFLYETLVSLRRMGEIDGHTEMVYSKKGYIEIFTDSGRLVRPLLVVSENGRARIDEDKAWDLSFAELLQGGYVEYIGSAEAEHVTIAYKRERLETRLRTIEDSLGKIEVLEAELSGKLGASRPDNIVKKGIEVMKRLYQKSLEPYHYLELHPVAMLGIAASLMPFSNLTHACRVSYQSKMFKQAMSIGKLDPSMGKKSQKVLAFPSTSVVQTSMDRIFGIDKHPVGTNVVVAIAAVTGFNQEDSFVFKKTSIERGAFRYIKTKIYETRVETKGENSERLKKPELKPSEDSSKYASIGDNGLPAIGSQLNEGDYIIGKIKPSATDNKSINVSVPLDIGDYGTVYDVSVIEDPKGLLVRVKIVRFMMPAIGNKFSSRYAQKGVIGMILNDEDMPFDDRGISPDVIINPHSIPSRMTVGYTNEIILGLAAAMLGVVVDATAYQEYNYEGFEKVLVDNGFRRDGERAMTNGMTGERFHSTIFVGISYFQMLGHIAADKIQSRSYGLVNDITRQAVRGRKHGGGTRFGEMEVQAAISHGAAEFVKERICTHSDAYDTAFCMNCGVFATYNYSMSKFVCMKCGESGRVGTVTMPYVLKYLIQTLASIGIILAGVFQTESDQIERLEKMVEASHSGDKETKFIDEVIQDEGSENEELLSVGEVEAADESGEGESFEQVEGEDDE